MARVCRFHGTALVSVHPLASGHGRVVGELMRLGLLERLLLYKIRPGDSVSGYDYVVTPRFNPAGMAVIASMYLGSIWKRRASEFRWVHLSSPHFFHLSKHHRGLTGIVHDLGHLESPALSRSPLGYRYLMEKEIEWASHLRGVVAVSEVTAEGLRGVNRDVAPVVIHNWTGAEFRYRDRSEARRTLGLPIDRRLLLSVGLDVPRKNIDILPSLLTALGPEYTLVRIGDTQRIRDRFAPHALISFPSVPDSLYPLFFNAADVLLYPSLFEGFGVPLIEAINSGTPLVASDIPVFREVLFGKGFLVGPNDVNRWAEASRAACEISEERRRDGTLYAHIGDHYRPARAAVQYSEFFRGAGLA